MEELTKHIKRDLFDIKENINNPDKLMELFSFPREEFENIIHDLKFSVEDGLFEFKSTAVNLILDPLKSLQYDSRAMSSYEDQIRRARGLLAVTLVQRLIAIKAVKISDNKEEEPRQMPADQINQTPIRQILEFVKEEPPKNPEIQKDPLFKKILMHIKMFRSETQKMNELSANVSADKRIALKRNFDLTLAEQVFKMREAYEEIINTAVKNEQPATPANILLRYDFKSMSKYYMLQIEAFSALLSTLTFAKNEKFQTRELLLNLTKNKEAHMNLITRERSEYINIVPFDKKAVETGKAFVRRIITFFEKEKDWLRIHPGRQ